MPYEFEGVEYDGHRLTRRGMEQTLAQGRSVIHNGVIISDPNRLPSEADLAQGNPEREAVVRAVIQSQIAALNRQLAGLGAPSPDVAEPLGPGAAGHLPAGMGAPNPDLAGAAALRRDADLQTALDAFTAATAGGGGARKAARARAPSDPGPEDLSTVPEVPTDRPPGADPPTKESA